MRVAAKALAHLDPTRHAQHPLHVAERAFPESNCYVDLWIELAHALGLDLLGACAFTLSTGFEGDQWTFFKPPLGELDDLFGFDVQELCVYRALSLQIQDQLALGRVVITEADSFFLPDTAGTTYHAAHGKTAIGIAAIDVDAKELWYFHNRGYYRLGPEDFTGALREGTATSLANAPYVELVRFDAVRAPSEAEIVAFAKARTRAHLKRAPGGDPVGALTARFSKDLAARADGGMAAFHELAFPTLRQLGPAFELAAAFARWLDAHGVPNAAAAPFDEVVGGAKTLMFKAARAVNGKKVLDASAISASMTAARQAGLDALAAAVSTPG